MDIILNTRFDNPRLPKLIRPGFSDDFNRTAGNPLGYTDDGKLWMYQPESPEWTITVDGHASAGSDVDVVSNAVVDAAASDGVLTARVGKANVGAGSETRGGVIVRYLDAENYMGMYSRGNGMLNILKRVNGVLSTIETDLVLSDGAVFSVVCDGPDVEFSFNGVPAGTRSAPELAGATIFGLVTLAAWQGRHPTWDSINFAPA